MQIGKNNPLVPYKPKVADLALEFLTDFVHKSSPRTKGFVIVGVSSCVTAIGCTAIKHYSKAISENGCTIKFKDLVLEIKSRNQSNQSAKSKQTQKH